MEVLDLDCSDHLYFQRVKKRNSSESYLETLPIMSG